MTESPNNESKFDLNEFNDAFDKMLQLAEKETKGHEKTELERFKRNRKDVESQTPITELTVGDILGGIAGSFFGVMDDLFHLEFHPRIFIKQRRLFYFGVMLLLIGLVYIIGIHLFKKEHTLYNHTHVPSLMTQPLTVPLPLEEGSI